MAEPFHCYHILLSAFPNVLIYKMKPKIYPFPHMSKPFLIFPFQMQDCQPCRSCFSPTALDEWIRSFSQPLLPSSPVPNPCLCALFLTLLPCYHSLSLCSPPFLFIPCRCSYPIPLPFSSQGLVVMKWPIGLSLSIYFQQSMFVSDWRSFGTFLIN